MRRQIPLVLGLALFALAAASGRDLVSGSARLMADAVRDQRGAAASALGGCAPKLDGGEPAGPVERPVPAARAAPVREGHIRRPG